MDDTKIFTGFTDSDLGVALLLELNKLKDSLIDDAMKSSDINLLNKAGGVIKVIEHLQFLSIK